MKNQTTSHKQQQQQQQQQQLVRTTPTSSIKKHLNLLKSNSKKVLLGSSSAAVIASNVATVAMTPVGNRSATLKSSSTAHHSSNVQTKTSANTSCISATSNSTLNFSLTNSPNSSCSSSSDKQHVYLAMKLNEYETKIRELNTEIDSSQRNSTESRMKIKELQMEIERLSRLYDFEISKQSKYEEKMLALKQMAEEKQIESAALKYEYRKVQEIKDNLIAENNSLKSFLNSLNLHHSPSNLLVLPNLLNVSSNSRHSSPSSSFNSPRVVHISNSVNTTTSITATNNSNNNNNTINNNNTSFSTAPSTPVISNSLQIQGNYSVLYIYFFYSCGLVFNLV
jgi:hypothetical protein